MKIYVGNLSYAASEEFVCELFRRHGNVDCVWIVKSRVGSPHTNGFVYMPDDTDAEKAISMLDGVEFDGRAIDVHKART